MLIFFFFKQKTAYEITRRDWSSDVCSSDLGPFALAEDLPALRMAHDHVTATELRQHRHGHFAGIGAARMLGNVLRAPGDRRAAQALRHLAKVGERRADSALRRGAASSGDDRIEQDADRFPAAMHLPVAGHQPGACHAPEFYRIAVIGSVHGARMSLNRPAQHCSSVEIRPKQPVPGSNATLASKTL